MARTLVYQLCTNFWRGKGGLRAMTNHLKILNFLDVDYVWLGPIYESPFHDNGYDISDYQAIDPAYGTMEDFDEFVKVAHSYGIGVVMELVLNHTSLEHPWFEAHSEYYYCTELDYLYRWRYGLGGEEESWQYNEKQDKYYLSLFHRMESDLDWFPKRDSINRSLVREFRKIVEYWTTRHQVDGFHIDIPQALNRDLTTPEMDLSNLLFGNRATEIIREVFKDSHSPFVIVECLDPSYGGLTRYYAEYSLVDYVMNPLVKEEFARSQEFAEKIIEASCYDPYFMLDLETRDSLSRHMTPEDTIWTLFSSDAEGICLHQGQELGLCQKQTTELPENLIVFDENGMCLDTDLSPSEILSVIRADRCASLPLEEYDKQINNADSYLNLTKKWVKRWKEH